MADEDGFDKSREQTDRPAPANGETQESTALLSSSSTSNSSSSEPASSLSSSVVDMGAIVLPHHVQRLQHLVDDAVTKGARLLAGGRILSSAPGRQRAGEADSADGSSGSLTGQFYPPTILADVDQSMRVSQEEVFGPLLCVRRVRDADEAVRVANSTAFGLGASVFTSDRRMARDVAGRLRCGMVSLNDFATTYMCQVGSLNNALMEKPLLP